jgi:hypothetical protein
MSKRSHGARWEAEATWRLNNVLREQGLPAVSKEAVSAFICSRPHTCEACGTALIRGIQLNRWSLCVDHDHTTGKLRGLLCNRCNRCLGLFKESPVVLRTALCYLS